MEKVIYALWKDEAASRGDFNAHLLGHVGPELADLTRAVRINVQDELVLAGTSPRSVATDPQMEALVQV